MAKITIAVEVEEQIEPLLDQLEGHAAEQQTPLAGAAQDTRLAPAFEAAQRWLDRDLKSLSESK